MYIFWDRSTRGEERNVTDGLARYRVDVVATTVSDVVRCAGGWIFDRVMQGWAVNVLITQPCDTRALAILGATVNGPPVGCSDFLVPQVVSVTDNNPSDGDLVEHRLSAAARCFKAHALIAVDLPPLFDTHESFWVAGHPGKSKDFIAVGASGCAPEVVEAQVVTAVPQP